MEKQDPFSILLAITLRGEPAPWKGHLRTAGHLMAGKTASHLKAKVLLDTGEGEEGEKISKKKKGGWKSA